ncbi:MAG: DUF4369 domain-containing protein, partial [Lacibacter sp.]
MKYIVTICLLMMVAVQTQAQQSFTIKGNIRGAQENAKISIRLDSPESKTLAESVIKKGSFELKGKVPEAAIYVIAVEGAAQNLGVFLEAGNAEVNGHVDTLSRAVIKGSAVHDEFMQFRSSSDPYFMKLDQLGRELSNPAMQMKQDSLYNLIRN